MEREIYKIIDNLKLCDDVINEIKEYIGRIHNPVACIVQDLISNCYEEEIIDIESDSPIEHCYEYVCFYEYYFYIARYRYYEFGNRYGNKLELFDVDKYYEDYVRNPYY